MEESKKTKTTTQARRSDKYKIEENVEKVEKTKKIEQTDKTETKTKKVEKIEEKETIEIPTIKFEKKNKEIIEKDTKKDHHLLWLSPHLCGGKQCHDGNYADHPAQYEYVYIRALPHPCSGRTYRHPYLLRLHIQGAPSPRPMVRHRRRLHGSRFVESLILNNLAGSNAKI